MIDTGRTIAEVAREIGVGEQLLGRWVAAERAELERLRRENAQLRMDREFLTKLRPSSRTRVERRGGVRGDPRGSWPTSRVQDGRAAGRARSGYYAWAARRDAPPGPRATRRAGLAARIKEFHGASDGVNGAPRILADLREAGETVSRKTVARIMAAHGLRGISPRPWAPATTVAGETAHTIPDLVGRKFDTGELNRVWTWFGGHQTGGDSGWLPGR